ncbi:TetR family transcriptional regulator [Devosia sp. XJ19-1]|uniref:TetR family transcriptional regulator n=1 Tax=Devosia ureilytica TaxID=2952754 RepID=A0A9Q4FS14_9HYPH|nr:TetR/AcrR family transcriptional regulator [Devosia ureilytica]MCP8883243.1 TetR family transcriptional regulator [Devosia ureilytica]MCP8886389.1 TetR family transcriptional regulator [Devosia ureilytica]
MEVRRRQEDRRMATRRALISAARALFAAKGYWETSTPEIVAAAGVTRGALYHHYADKLALFTAVVEEEHALVALAINAATDGDDEETGPVKALVKGGDGLVEAMRDEGRRRILLVDAPAVLGREALDAIQTRQGRHMLVEAVDHAIAAGAIKALPERPLAMLLNALFDRAAQAPTEEIDDYRKVLKALIRGLKSK